jgi:hypothetical protein
MPDHLFSNSHIVVDLPIVNLEFEPNKIWQDRSAAGLRLDGWSPLTWCRTNDWKSVGKVESSVFAPKWLEMRFLMFAQDGGGYSRHDVRT